MTHPPFAYDAGLAEAVARYRRLNERRLGTPLIPRVGIFWVDTERCLVAGDPVPLAHADRYGELRIGPRGHYETWPEVQERHPHWRGRHYEDVPRGRVVWQAGPGRPRFLVYTAPRLRRLAAARAAIVAAFHLPAGHYHFDFSDHHYRLGLPD